MTTTLARKATAEAMGTGLLVAVIVGSGVFAQRLSPGDIQPNDGYRATTTFGATRRLFPDRGGWRAPPLAAPGCGQALRETDALDPKVANRVDSLRASWL